MSDNYQLFSINRICLRVKMKLILLLLVFIACAQVSAEKGSSSLKSMPSATRGLKKRGELVAAKVDSVSVVGAATKAAPPSAFDMKAAGQLAATFGIWYGFNAACKCGLSE